MMNGIKLSVVMLNVVALFSCLYDGCYKISWQNFLGAKGPFTWAIWTFIVAQ
jgi:hypothetical protein